MPKINQYFYPESLAQAYEYLNNPELKTRILAGGCSLIQQKTGDYDALIDITRLPINYIKEENSYLKIGAATPLSSLAKSPLLQHLAGGIVIEGVLNTASSHIRNQMTLGGNLAQPLWWCNLPPVFLALEARVKLFSGQETEISLEELYQRLPLRNEILTEINFARPANKAKGKFVKFSLTKQDFAILNLAAIIEGDEQNLKKVRLALASAIPMAMRLKQTENLLEGKKLTPELLENAGKTALLETKPLDEIRASAQYRSELIETLIKRTINELAQ